jgi:hypothetical protein
LLDKTNAIKDLEYLVKADSKRLSRLLEFLNIVSEKADAQKSLKPA